MAGDESQADDRLERYLSADPKYDVAPVPTPLEKETAAGFVRDHVDDKQSGARMDKLARLAVFYNLGDCAKTFEDVLGKKGREPDDYARSAAALVAIAWIGDERQWEGGQRHFHALLRRAEVRPHLEQMEGVCHALGAREGTAKLNEWIQKELDKLEAKWKDHEQKGEEQQAEFARRRLVSLRTDRDIVIDSLERANATRREIEDVPQPSARIAKLVKLYVDTANESTIELSYWCAMKLIRIAEQDPSLKPRVASQFMGLSQSYNRKGRQDEQDKLDVYRACCLRAAAFFGQELDEESADWLSKQDDAGTDVLALRPDWRY